MTNEREAIRNYLEILASIPSESSLSGSDDESTVSSSSGSMAIGKAIEELLSKSMLSNLQNINTKSPLESTPSSSSSSVVLLEESASTHDLTVNNKDALPESEPPNGAGQRRSEISSPRLKKLDQLVCEFCEKSHADRKALHHHIARQHGHLKVTYDAEKDLQDAKTVLAAAKPRQRNYHLPSYECGFCEARYKKEDNLRHHFSVHIKFGKWSVAQEKILDRMNYTHKCKLCPFVTKSLVGLNIHKQMKHLNKESEGKIFGCSTCGSKFKSKTALQMHLRSHTG